MSNGQRVEVVPYDPRWPALATAAATEVAGALAISAEHVHHIGSTAVPGLVAKPIIDLLAVAPDLSALDRRAAEMELIGFEVMGEFGIAGRRYYRRNDATGRRTHQVHAFAADSPHIARHLAFRDYLRAHPGIAAEYSDLKRRLAAQHAHDIEAYAAGKDAFIKKTEQQSLRWKGQQP